MKCKCNTHTHTHTQANRHTISNVALAVPSFFGLFSCLVAFLLFSLLKPDYITLRIKSLFASLVGFSSFSLFPNCPSITSICERWTCAAVLQVLLRPACRLLRPPPLAFCESPESMNFTLFCAVRCPSITSVCLPTSTLDAAANITAKKKMSLAFFLLFCSQSVFAAFLRSPTLSISFYIIALFTLFCCAGNEVFFHILCLDSFLKGFYVCWCVHSGGLLFLLLGFFSSCLAVCLPGSVFVFVESGWPVRKKERFFWRITEMPPNYLLSLPFFPAAHTSVCLPRALFFFFFFLFFFSILLSHFSSHTHTLCLSR